MSERKFQQSISDKEAIELELWESDVEDGEKLGQSEFDNETKENRHAVADTVFEVDPSSKSLTGRTPERLEQETGIPKEELFPEGKDIIYVGDPWQRMGVELDNEHIFIRAVAK